MVEVDVAAIRPQAAVVETHNVVEPVGITRNPRGLLVRRRAPVVGSVWGAAPSGVPGQQQRAGAVVAALLPRAGGGPAHGKRETPSFQVPEEAALGPSSALPGPDASDAVDASRVVRARAAAVQVTAVIGLKGQSGRERRAAAAAAPGSG